MVMEPCCSSSSSPSCTSAYSPYRPNPMVRVSTSLLHDHAPPPHQLYPCPLVLLDLAPNRADLHEHLPLAAQFDSSLVSLAVPLQLPLAPHDGVPHFPSTGVCSSSGPLVLHFPGSSDRSDPPAASDSRVSMLICLPPHLGLASVVESVSIPLLSLFGADAEVFWPLWPLGRWLYHSSFAAPS